MSCECKFDSVLDIRVGRWDWGPWICLKCKQPIEIGLHKEEGDTREGQSLE